MASMEPESGAPRHPHPGAAAEITLKDLEENQGWRVTWDESACRFLVACPHGTFTYRLPVTLDPGWRWHDHFRQMQSGHRQECAGAA